MFKALILTDKPIQNLKSSINRLILSKTQDKIQYSPLKLSPNKNLSQQKLPEQCQAHFVKSPQNNCKQSNQQNQKVINKNEKKVEEFQSRINFKITELDGNLKLFHQYHLKKFQDNLNSDLIQNKKQQLITLPRFNTNILAVINVSSSIYKILLQKFGQVQDEIQAVDSVQRSSSFESNQQSQNFTCDLIVYFKNSFICEEFYKLCYHELHVLSVFLKEVIILQARASDRLTYKEVLKTLDFFQPSNDSQQNQNRKEMLMQESKKCQFQWIQLPKCIDCLLKLEYQVAGIDQKILFDISEKKTQRKISHKQQKLPPCNACTILDLHRKDTENRRKLSYEEGYKDSNKSEKHAHCDDCKQKNDIWICMVCGSVGCGRYKNADAYKHFVNSGHIITIDLQTERVWNYLSDCFSHKILKTFNEPKKNVKFPEISQNQANNIQNSKLEAAFWQYCSVFSDQMQRQRIFYENIKKSQEQKFQMQKDRLQRIIEQLGKQNEEKQLQLRRSLKKKGKALKKQQDLQSKVDYERQIFKQQQECLSADYLNILIENDEQILKRKKQLQSLDKELNDILLELSNS